MRCALLLLALAACGTDTGPQGTDPGTDPMPDAQQQYLESCAGCHGLDGDGTATGPQLRNPVHGYALYVIRNGRTDQMGFGQAMPAFTADQLPDPEPILAWLARPPHPADGQTLFVRYCGNCHGADAQGGRVGEDITHEAREGTHELLEKVREGHGGTSYASRTKYMPSWAAADLSDADVAAIAAYLGGLPPGPGDGDDDDDDDDHDDD